MMMFRTSLIALLFIGATLSRAGAQAPAEDPPPIDEVTRLETVVVTGVMPGPGLWKVRHGDHVMWILGTVQPVARRMQWESAEVERVIGEVDMILYPPSLKFDLGMGRLRSLMLLPSLLKARRDPDGDTLAERVGADDYRRWLQLKQKYLGRDRAVEKRRPLFAADELYRAALKRSGLELRGLASPVLRRVAKKRRIPTEQPVIELSIEDPRAAIRQFRETPIDDAECFRKTLDHLESDLETMRARANAWARGDLIALRELAYEDQSQACMNAFLESRFAEQQGMDDLVTRARTLWIAAAEKILHEHERSFAVLSMGHMVSPDGYLAELAARGYEIEAP